MSTVAETRLGTVKAATGTVMPVLLAISLVHLLNDAMQAVVPALFPILEDTLRLSYMQIGWISLVLNMTSSVIQPVVGLYTDHRSSPYMLPAGMALSLLGMVGIALAPSFWWVLLAVLFIGLGSAVFHPEGSRVVYFAAGNRRGLAQSVYQVGGNAGSSLAPLMTVFIFVPLGQIGALWGTAFAVLAIVVLLAVAPWYKQRLVEYRERSLRAKPSSGEGTTAAPSANKSAARSSGLASHPRVKWAMGLLVFIIFARSWYHASISNYFQFYLEEDYGLTKAEAQIPIFLFLLAGVLGTLFGGMAADRIGMKRMIAISMCGAIPFALALPHLPLVWIYPAIFVMGFILLSGFSVSVVYAQQIMPANVGMASGLTTGLAFGMGAIGAVAIGKAADLIGLTDVMVYAGFLPLLGLLAFLLPSDRK